MTLRRRIEDLEAKPQMQPPDEKFLRCKLAAEALWIEDRNLFNHYLDMVEAHPCPDRKDAALHAMLEERAAFARLKELEELPLEQLRGLVA